MTRPPLREAAYSFGFADSLEHAHVVLDPSRIAAQVVSGICFPGAGAILFRLDKIRGLTTAASLWTVAGVGLAAGGGMYVAAAGSTAIVLVILVGLKPLERHFWSPRGGSEFVLVVDRQEASPALLQSELTSVGMAIRTVSIEPGDGSDEDEIRVGVQTAAPDQMIATLERLRSTKGVRSVEIRG